MQFLISPRSNGDLIPPPLLMGLWKCEYLKQEQCQKLNKDTKYLAYLVAFILSFVVMASQIIW